MRYLILMLPIAACGDANHLGNPLLLPASGVATAYQNAGYNARRAKVKSYLMEHNQALRAEEFSGQHAASLYAIANVPPSDHRKVAMELSATEQSSDWVEQATVIVMVHGDN